MSCDWNVHCKTCGDTHRFDDANHAVELMRALVKHASAIALLAPLFNEGVYDVELRTPYGWIDVAWFAQHAGHALVPIDEYGRTDHAT